MLTDCECLLTQRIRVSRVREIRSPGLKRGEAPGYPGPPLLDPPKDRSPQFATPGTAFLFRVLVSRKRPRSFQTQCIGKPP